VPFPDLSNANEDGLLAMGGDLSVDNAQGIFPWFNEDQPILWWSPDPRLVMYPQELKVSRSLRKTIRSNRFQVSCDTAFSQVVRCCALRGSDKPFAAKAETWITEGMHQAYQDLFENGYAHSIEVWDNSDDNSINAQENPAKLVGGLYGVVLGKVFFGESMFSEVSNASKVAMVALCNWLHINGFTVIDCQVASDHLFSLGAKEIPREQFTNYLADINIGRPRRDFADGFSTEILREPQNLL